MRLFIAPAILAGLPVTVAAQIASGSLDVGTARMTYADSIEASSASISPAFRVWSPRASFGAFGTYSQLSGAWTHSGRLDATLVPLAFGRVSTEIGGLAGGSTHSNGTRTGQMMGSARLHLGGVSRGAWVGGGLGRTWDGSWRIVAQADAGAWFIIGQSAVVANIAPTIVDDTIRYSDAQVSLRAEVRKWELDGSLGFRAGDQVPTLPANRNTWGNVSVTWWAVPRAGIAAAVGTYPVDFTQGYPGGQYFSISARLRSAPSVIQRANPTAERATASGLLAFSVQRLAGDSHQIRVRAPGARKVEVYGDFTMWSPVAMRPAGNGWWTAVLPLSRGTHEVNVRLDGGAWLVPPGTISKADEFGGAVGVLVVR